MPNKKPDTQHTKAYVSNRAIEVLVKFTNHSHPKIVDD